MLERIVLAVGNIPSLERPTRLLQVLIHGTILPPTDPNSDPNPPPPAPYVMFPPPGIMYGYPPPPAPPQGTYDGPHPHIYSYARIV
jgi:hypothetical protein